MLVARGHKTLAGARLTWAFTFVPEVWAAVVERRGLVLDTRFVPAVEAPPQPRACLYLLVHGDWVVHGGAPVAGPAAFAVTEAQLEGASGARPFTSASTGEPFRAVEIHVPDGDLRLPCRAPPSPTPLGPAALETGRALFEGGLAARDDAGLSGRYRALIDALVDEDLLTPRVGALVRRRPRRSFELLWGAIRPMVERLYLTPTLQEVSDESGVSTRQIDRYVSEFVRSFGLWGHRWRSTTLRLRLKLAVILLSADDASAGDVAGAVGYGSADAMSRAFRDAGLPSPTVVQAELRDARRA